MNKSEIIAEIKRIAKENQNIPPGKKLFERFTGIKESSWYGKYWVRWSEALKEAGYQSNTMQKPYDDVFLIEKFVDLIIEMDKFPTNGELRYKSTKDASFPSHNTFRKLGNQQELAQKIIDYCEKTDSHQEIIPLCLEVVSKSKKTSRETEIVDTADDSLGYVYLIKSGKYYKLGRSNSPGRRYYELNLQLPERIKVIHQISTDDPAGIEEYWHKRFQCKRKNGEWFELDRNDVKTFKKRKFM